MPCQPENEEESSGIKNVAPVQPIMAPQLKEKMTTNHKEVQLLNVDSIFFNELHSQESKSNNHDHKTSDSIKSGKIRSESHLAKNEDDMNSLHFSSMSSMICDGDQSDIISVKAESPKALKKRGRKAEAHDFYVAQRLKKIRAEKLKLKTAKANGVDAKGRQKMRNIISALNDRINKKN